MPHVERNGFPVRKLPYIIKNIIMLPLFVPDGFRLSQAWTWGRMAIHVRDASLHISEGSRCNSCQDVPPPKCDKS
jgi:hypothetical protein